MAKKKKNYNKIVSKFVNKELLYDVSIGDIMFVVGTGIILGKLQGWF